MTVLIDQLQPRYDARLLHLADVPQPPAVVRQAMEAVTFADLPALGLLVRVRNLGRRKLSTSVRHISREIAEAPPLGRGAC
jgi:hypothetical protein